MRVLAYVLVCLLALLLFFANIHANNAKEHAEVVLFTLCDNLNRLYRERPDIAKRYFSKEILEILKGMESNGN